MLEPDRIAGLEAPGPDLERRGRARGDRAAEGVLEGPLRNAGGEKGGKEDVSGSDSRYGLHARRVGADQLPLPLDPEEAETPRLRGDEDIAGAHVRDAVERHHKVLVVPELLPNQALGLTLVRGDEERFRLDAETKRLTFAVEHGADVATVEVADRLCVEGVLDVTRERAREHDHVRATREVADLAEQHRELLRHDLRAPLVDLGVRPRRRINDGGGRARLVPDAHEVVEDRLGCQLLDDARTGASAREPGRHDRDVEPLERARDVDPLAPGQRESLARAVALAQLEVRHRDRPVERDVERDGDDHVNQSPMWLNVRPA